MDPLLTALSYVFIFVVGFYFGGLSVYASRSRQVDEYGSSKFEVSGKKYVVRSDHD